MDDAECKGHRAEWTLNGAATVPPRQDCERGASYLIPSQDPWVLENLLLHPEKFCGQKQLKSSVDVHALYIL